MPIQDKIIFIVFTKVIQNSNEIKCKIYLVKFLRTFLVEFAYIQSFGLQKNLILSVI